MMCAFTAAAAVEGEGKAARCCAAKLLAEDWPRLQAVAVRLDTREGRAVGLGGGRSDCRMENGCENDGHLDAPGGDRERSRDVA
jgi:hypothetical protein